MAYNGLPFPDTTWLLCTECLHLLLYLIWLMFGEPFPHLSTSLGCFCPRTFFLNNGLDDIKWAIFIPDLHTKLRIIRRRLSDFATGSPCDVWINHLPPVWWYTFRFIFLMTNVVWIRYSWEEFSIDFLPLFMFFNLTQILPVFFFYCEITLYIKYFVLPYSIDVAWIISY